MTKKLQICGWPYSILHQTETTSFKVLNSTNLCARDCCFHCSMFEMWCEMTYSCCCSFHNQISLGVDSTHPVTSTSHLELLPSLVLYTVIVTPFLEHHALHLLVGTWQCGSILLLHKLCGLLTFQTHLIIGSGFTRICWH